MNRKVKSCRLQTEVFHGTGVGQLGITFPPLTKAIKDLEMYCNGADGITMAFSHNGVKKELWVPSSNVVFAELEPLPVAPPKVAKA